MPNFSQLLDACDAVGSLARESGVGLLDANDDRFDGRTIEIDGRSVLNFSSCSYLGLELDERLIEGAIDATRRYGTQFSMSRAFVSAPAYAELERLLETITGGPSLVLPSTTLATAAALPSLVDARDAVILDQQVHMSVQTVAPLLEKIGVHVEALPHSRIDLLEERILALQSKHPRVWYMLDGVFGMHGDFAPFDELRWLLERHPALHLYVDDAHGTSWAGRFGRGLALESLEHRERVVVALSLNKSFGAGGGALSFPTVEMRDRVRHVSGPTNFSGPLQPPMLGAAVASALLHVSGEVAGLQSELLRRVEYTNHAAAELALPLLHGDTLVPIRFIGLGSQAASVAMAKHLLAHGLLPSCALFPAVPMDQTGIRFSVTRHHALEDIDLLLDTMANFLPEALAIGGTDRARIDRVFGLKPATRA